MIERIPLTQGYTTIIDPEDIDVANCKWFASKRNNGHVYACRDIRPNGKQKRIYLHRLILERKLGHPLHPEIFADHINRDSLDNRRSNLRAASPSQNIANSKRMERKERKMRSPYRGVYWIKERRRWRAQISVAGKTIYLGYFDIPEQAAIAYNAAALAYRPRFARLNKIPDTS